MKKSIISGLALAIVTAMAASGCGANNNTANNAPATAAPATVAPASEAPATTAAAPDTATADTATTEAPATDTATAAAPVASADQDQQNWFGAYDTPVTVNLAVASNAAMTFPDGWSYGNNIWTTSWKSDLNVDANVVWEAVQANGDYDTKLNLAIASNDLPDIIFFNTQAQFQQCVQAGLVQDITDIYNTYAYPRLKSNMEADGECMSWGNVGGKLLGIPQGSVNLPTARMIFIRDDWFKATGLPAPKTIEDVVAIAKAMRAQDPTVRFDFQLGTQIGAQDGMSGIVGLANCYGGYPGIWVPDGNGGLEYGSIQPAVKTALQVYADSYADGGIDPGFPSYDGGKLAEQLTGGNVGVAISEVWLPSWPLNSLYDTDQVDWDTYPLLASGTLTSPLKIQCDAPSGRVFAVKTGYDHPEVLFKLLNYAVEKIDDPATATPESLLAFHAGPPPENWGYGGMTPLGLWGDPMTNFNTQKRIMQAFSSGDTSVLNSNPQDLEQYNIVARFLDEQKTGQPTGDADIGNDWGTYKYWYGDNSGYGVLNAYVANDQFMIDGLNGYMTPTMLKQWSSLLDLENQYFMQIISGQRPISDFDAFVSAWKAGGGDTITQEVNAYIQSRK